MAITVVDGVEGKVCPKCDPPTWKPRGLWSPDRRKNDGRASICKDCNNKRNRAATELNPQAKRERDKRYWENNKEKIRKSQLDWYYKNRDSQLERAKDYRKENREKRRNYNREWLSKHPEKQREYWVNARARRANAPGRFTADDILLMLEHQQYLCYYCGVILIDSHIEHKTPVTRGGSNDPSNLCVACAQCNRIKHTKTEGEFMAWCSRRSSQTRL